MAFVITSLCVDCKDTACADVCPVECIYEYKGSDPSVPNQLFIHPDECIDCTNCEPACPWKAIFEQDDVPGVFADSVAQNGALADDIGDYVVAKVQKKASPTPDEVRANDAKHGFKR